MARTSTPWRSCRCSVRRGASASLPGRRISSLTSSPRAGAACRRRNRPPNGLCSAKGLSSFTYLTLWSGLRTRTWSPCASIWLAPVAWPTRPVGLGPRAWGWLACGRCSIDRGRPMTSSVWPTWGRASGWPGFASCGCSSLLSTNTSSECCRCGRPFAAS